MTISQGLRVIEEDTGPTIDIGEHTFAGLTIGGNGPIIENLTPGAPNPLRCAWIPVLFEGGVFDPRARCRIVHQDEALLVGLPESHPLPEPGVRATPEQLLSRLHAVSYEERIAILTALINTADTGIECFKQDHAGQLARDGA